MVERAIIADDRRFANHDSRAMIDEKVRPIVQGRMDFNPGFPFADHHDPLGQELQMVLPKEVGHGNAA
jgi:hypothetical protein